MNTGKAAGTVTPPPQPIQYSILDAWMLSALALAGLVVLLPDMRGAARLTEADWRRSSDAVLVVLGLSVAVATITGALLGILLAARLRLGFRTRKLAALFLACVLWPAVFHFVPQLIHVCFHWQPKPQTAYDLTLVDQAFANAEGSPGMAQPKCGGYVFPVLTGQAQQKTYITGTTLAFGSLNAVPAAYDGSGRNCFRINNAGTVYGLDVSAPPGVQTYNPSEGWVAAE